LEISKDEVLEYIGGFYVPEDDDMAALRELNEKENIPLIWRETEMIMGMLLDIAQPHTILEVGTAVGYSACFMSKHLGGDVKVTTIENDYDRFMQANENVSRQKCSETVNLICDDAVHALKQLHDSGRMFDFVFIDAAKSHYSEFWDEAVKMVHKGSIIVCDNVLMRSMTVIPPDEAEHKHRTNIRNMRNFLEYITNLENVKTIVTEAGDGLSISYIR
jgi:Predicted O-methyltransferase